MAGRALVDEEVYTTHMNGARPFLVRILGKRVRVFRMRPQPADEEPAPATYEDDPCFDKEVLRIFVGKSPRCGLTDGRGPEICAKHGADLGGGQARFGPRFDGNSLLVHTRRLAGEAGDAFEYVAIGDAVESFATSAEIVEYVSPMGNSDVPYPYAVDSRGRVYAMQGLDASFILSPADVARLRETGDVYAMHDAAVTIAGNENVEPLHPGFRGVTGWTVGGKKRMLMCWPDRKGKGPAAVALKIYGVDSGAGGGRAWPEATLETVGGAVPLTLEEYVGLTEAYRALSDVRPIQLTTISECPL